MIVIPNHPIGFIPREFRKNLTPKRDSKSDLNAESVATYATTGLVSATNCLSATSDLDVTSVAVLFHRRSALALFAKCGDVLLNFSLSPDYL
jgi:hypothetical protein